MFYLFASNALFTAGFTFLYEKFKSDSINFIPPKANGAVTPLAFTFAFLALNPDYAIFK